MSYPLGTKIRLVQSWRTYSKGAVLEQGYVADLEQLVQAGLAVRLEEVEDKRPARLSRKAAGVIQTSGQSTDLLTK